MSEHDLLQPHQDPGPDAVSVIPVISILNNNDSVDNIDQLMGDLLDSSRIPSQTDSQVIDMLDATVAEAAEEVHAHHQHEELPEATDEFIDLGSPIVSSNATSSWGELPSVLMSDLMQDDANITQTDFEILDDPENEM